MEGNLLRKKNLPQQVLFYTSLLKDYYRITWDGNLLQVQKAAS